MAKPQTTEAANRIAEILRGLTIPVEVCDQQHGVRLKVRGPVTVGCGNAAHLTVYDNGTRQWQGEAETIEWVKGQLRLELGLS